MRRTPLPRSRTATGWVHPYPLTPFSPVLYADGGGGDSDGSASGAGGNADGGQGQGQQDTQNSAGTSADQAGSGDNAQDGDTTDWKARAREWERRAKANSKAADELERVRKANMSAQEKAVAEAEVKGRTAAASEYGRELAQARLEAAAAAAHIDLSAVAE